MSISTIFSTVFSAALVPLELHSLIHLFPQINEAPGTHGTGESPPSKGFCGSLGQPYAFLLKRNRRAFSIEVRCFNRMLINCFIKEGKTLKV